MKNQLTLRQLKTKQLKAGDKVRLIDGSALTAEGYDKEVYTVLPYPDLTGREEKLKELEATVIETDIKDKFILSSGLDLVYQQDIKVQIGKAYFHTSSALVARANNYEAEGVIDLG